MNATQIKLAKRPGKPFTLHLQVKGTALMLRGLGVILLAVSAVVWLGARLYAVFA